MDNLFILQFLAMLRSIAASTMSAQGLCYVPPTWIGQTQSSCHAHYADIANVRSNRVKSKLRNGEVMISGDQWPIFLYADYKFDPEEPWKGLLRSGILLAVRTQLPTAINELTQLS